MIVRRWVQEVHLLTSVVVIAGALACGTAREPTSPPPFAPAHFYEVRAGESLSEIAECSGLAVTELARLNGIADPDRVQAGTRLGLPSGHPCVRAPRPPVAVSTPQDQVQEQTQEAVSPTPKE